MSANASRVRSAESAVDELKVRPALRRDVRVHPPEDEGASWVLQDGGAKYLRIGSDLGALLLLLDGTRAHDELATSLGPRWNPQAVSVAVDNLWERGLLCDGSDTRAPSRQRVVKYVPPLTLQLTVLRPERLLGAVHPVLRALGTRTAKAAGLLLLVAGAAALAAQAPLLVEAFTSPLPLAVVITVMLATWATTVVHEFAHGAVLTYHGGRATRMGVMLFYLLPAFFCDMSDAWRLPRREQRVRIALAGVSVQVLTACVAFVAGAVPPLSDAGRWRDAVLVFGVSMLVSAVLNLIPFVKLDGYIALMSHVDVPMLRDRSMALARARAAHVVLGSPLPPRDPHLPAWAVPYGFASLLFPLVLFAAALGLWGELLLGLGVVGAVAVGLLVLGLLARLAGAVVTAVRDAARAGVAPRRLATGLGGAAVLLIAVGTIPVPYTVTGGYLVDGSGASLVLSETDDLDAVTAGAPVRLARQGFLARSMQGSARVAPGAPGLTPVPLTAIVPVVAEEIDDGFRIEMPTRDLRVLEQPEAPVGTAVVDLGSRPLWRWLQLTYLAPLLRW